MKKALLFVFATLIIGPLMAQVTFGPKAGITLSKYGYKFSDEASFTEPTSKYKLGPALGVVMNLQINDFLAFQPSLMYSKKGSGIDVADQESGDANITGYFREKISYLELPLNLAVGLKLGNVKFQIFAGPYFAYAIAGKQKWDYEENINGVREDIKGDRKIKFVNEVPEDRDEDVSYQRPFDIGLNFGVGYKIDNILLNLGYAMGFSNMQPDHPDDNSFADDHKYLNRTIFINAAWLFGNN